MKKLMKSVLACLLAFAMVLTVMPVNSYAAAKKSVVVTNQKQLEKALKNGATNIVIKTNKNVKITIPATKKAAKASISVQAKNATITNKASVKSIVIKDAKAFVESGKNNDIKITDSKLSLTVAKGSKGADIKKCPNLDIREYIDNMATCMAAADLVISRAGAITLSEIQALGKPAILIPSPNVAENHQYHNAMALVNNKAAEIIEEKDLTEELLIEKVDGLLQNKEKLAEYSQNSKKMAIIDANERIYSVIRQVLGAI